MLNLLHSYTPADPPAKEDQTHRQMVGDLVCGILVWMSGALEKIFKDSQYSLKNFLSITSKLKSTETAGNV